MTSDIKKRGLGRGLDALFRDVKSEEASFAPRIKRADEIVAAATAVSEAGQPRPAGVQKISIGKLRPGKFQPRRHFDDGALKELSESIAVHGVIQPLLVRRLSGDSYEIIAGERRWRAAQKAQVHEVPVVIAELDDNAALEIALIENLQREDLTALEEAEGYQRLMDEFHHTQDELAQHLGKSRSHVANMLRLLKLTPFIKKLVETGKLSAGHARALLGCTGADQIAEVVVKRGLSVRQTEKLVQGAEGGKVKKAAKPSARKGLMFKDVDVLALEEKISTILGMKVSIDGEGANGVISVEYKSLDQLDDIVARLSRTPGR